MARAARGSDEESEEVELERERMRNLERAMSVMGAGGRRRAGGDERGPWTADGVDKWG
jgi:hypothetical protein